MAPKLVVEWWRGRVLEDVHRVVAVRVDAAGEVVQRWGDVDRVVPVRSTAKALQALALVRSGAADALAVRPEELAIAAGSHRGEADHVAVVEGWLARLDVDGDALRCGAALPGDAAALAAHLRSGGGPRRVLHNCSGKHAGFLTLARHLGADPSTYLDRDGPVQRAVLAEVAGALDVDLGPDDLAGDGCGAPVPCVPLVALARGFAVAVATPAGARVVAAQAAHPRMVAGTGRLDTVLGLGSAGALVSKVGADGVYVAVRRDGGGGVWALKCLDGSVPAAEHALVHLLVGAGALGPGVAPAALADPVVRDSNGRAVGRVAVVEERSERSDTA